MFFGDFEVFTLFLLSPENEAMASQAKPITKDFAEFL